MKNNEIIPIPIENKSGKKPKRRNKFFIKLVVYFSIVMIIFYSYNHFDDIKPIFKDFNNNANNTQNDNSNDSSFDSSNSNSNNNDTTTDNEPNNDSSNNLPIPNNGNKINSIENAFIAVNNESGIDLNFDLSSEVFPTVNSTYEQYGKDAPFILIIHSNCNEGYSNGEYYTFDDDFYNTKNNVKTVGKVIFDTLNEKHVNAIHIYDIFGSGSIYNSRKEMEKAISEILKMYPSIKIILDISRDVSINDDLTMDKEVTEINGKNVSQISLIVGSNIENGTVYTQNLNFAMILLNESNNLINEITVAPFILSQDINPIFLKVDIGSYANTVDEATLAGYEFAHLLCNVLS